MPDQQTEREVSSLQNLTIQGYPAEQLLAGLTAVDTPTLELIANVGQLVRVTTRAMHSYLGVLVGLQFKAEVVELALSEKRRDYGDGKDYNETKVAYIPVSNLHSWEVVTERQEVESESATGDALLSSITTAFEGG